MNVLQEAILLEAIRLLKIFPKDTEVWESQTKIIKRILKEIEPDMEEVNVNR